jgi:hypothetical protein
MTIQSSLSTLTSDAESVPSVRSGRAHAGNRQRMYLFERAYVDFARLFRGMLAKLTAAHGHAWRWCWSGPGVKVARVLVYMTSLIASLALGRAYVLYEKSISGQISGGVIASTAFTILLTLAILYGWSAPAAVLARAVGGIAAVSVLAVLTVVGVALALGLFLPYIVLLLALTTLSFVAFLPLRLVHGIWLLYYRIAHRCPYDDCGGSKQPIHVCSCGARYPDLVPNFYGVFYHQCRHPNGDEKLPTLDLLGRKKLPRLCGDCKRPVVHSSLGELPEQPILLVGAAEAGKTVFLRQAVRRLRERLAQGRGNSVRLDSADQERKFEAELRELDQGQPLQKTTGDTVTAMGVAIRLKTPQRYRRLLQIFDAPGEHFESEREFGKKQIFKHLGGIVLIVDPFSLPGLADVEIAGQRTVATPFEQVVSSLLGVLTTHGVLERGQKSKVPLAVVLGKADALVETMASEVAGLAAQEPDDDSSARCQRALLTLGGGNSLRALEHGFERTRFFAASALGRAPDPRDMTPFQPLGVEAPLLWLMSVGAEP